MLTSLVGFKPLCIQWKGDEGGNKQSLYSGNAKTSTFANSVDPVEMQHNAAFQLGLHCF